MSVQLRHVANAEQTAIHVIVFKLLDIVIMVDAKMVISLSCHLSLVELVDLTA